MTSSVLALSGYTEGTFNLFGDFANALKRLFEQPDTSTKDAGQTEQIPTISGAKNRSGANQPIPVLLGESMYTPILIGQPYTDIDPTDGSDGENQYFHALYCLGYNNIDLKSVSLGIFKLSTDEKDGTSGALDCTNLERQTITVTRTYPVFAVDAQLRTGVVPQIKLDIDGYEVLSINSVDYTNLKAYSSAVFNAVYMYGITNYLASTVTQRTITGSSVSGDTITFTASGVPQNAFVKLMGVIEVNVTLREKTATVHYKKDDDVESGAKGYHQQLELQQGSDEVSLYPQKVVQENSGTELMHPEDAGWVTLLPFSAKYPQKIQLEIQFQNLVRYHSNGEMYTSGSDRAYVDIGCAYSTDGGVTFSPFPFLTTSSSAVTITQRSDGTFADGSGTYSVTRFQGCKNKAMRFLAEKTFTYAEVFDNVKNNIIEFRIFRVSEDKSVTNQKYQYKCFFNAIRTWCYDYDATKEYAEEHPSAPVLQPQIPLIAKYRNMTARLGFKIRAGDELNGTIDELNVVQVAKARYCTTTIVNDEPVYTWSNANQTRATNNPSALALMLLQHPMRGEYAYTDDEIDLDSFGEFYDWCEQTDTELINSDGRKYTANGVISKQMKTIDLVNQILATGHGKLIIKGNKYAVLYDKPLSTPVMVLNNQNIIEQKNTKNFNEEIDGYACKFVDCLNDYQEDTQIFVPKDIQDPNSPNYKPKDQYKLENIEVAWITDAGRAYRACMYQLACRKLRPEVWEVKVGVDGNLVDIGSLVAIQNDTILVGIGDGAQITEVTSSDGYITGIKVDYPFTVADATKTYGITIQHADSINGVNVRTYLLESFVTTGEKDTLVFAEAISTSATIKPAVGDIVSFGIADKITTDAICTNKKENNDGTFNLTLVPYQKDIYDAEFGTIPEFVSNVTPPTDNGIAISEELPQVSLEQVSEVAEAVMNEGTDDPPSAPTNLTAVAEEVGIQLKWTPVESNGLNNTIKHYVVEISRDSGTTWTALGTTFNSDYFYAFNRTVDKYPEATVPSGGRVEGEVYLVDYLFRIKAVNIYGYESSYLTLQAVNTNSYGTWHISELVVTTEVIDRTAIITVVYGGSLKVYGNLRTRVRIKRNGNTYPVSNTTYNQMLGITPDATWFTPEFARTVQPSENYDYENNYRKNTDTAYETSGNKISHTLPLIGQTPRIFKAGDIPVMSGNSSLYTKDVPNVTTVPPSPSAGDVIHFLGEQTGFETGGYYLYENNDWVQVYSKQIIVSTSYQYEISMTNDVNTTFYAEPLVIEALCTNISDIVHSHEHYKNLYVEKLSAINANLGMISQGGMGDFDPNNGNYWALSNLSPEDSGILGGIKKGAFRVGGADQYLKVTPLENGKYEIELKAGNITLTSQGDGTTFSAGTYIYDSTDSHKRLMLTPTGFIAQKEVQKGTAPNQYWEWENVAKIITDSVGNLIVTNLENFEDEYPIGTKLASGDVIYHFDSVEHPENCEAGTNPQTITCTGDVVSTKNTDPILLPDSSKYCFEGTVEKTISGFTGNMVVFSKADKIKCSGILLSPTGITNKAIEYNALMSETIPDTQQTYGDYLGLSASQISSGIFKNY